MLLDYLHLLIQRSNATTFADMLQKHPSLHPDAVIPNLASDPPPSVPVTFDEIVRAIQLFNSLNCGCAGGPDGLRPQHLKDMVSLSAHSGGTTLVEALQSIISLILSALNKHRSQTGLFFLALL